MLYPVYPIPPVAPIGGWPTGSNSKARKPKSAKPKPTAEAAAK